MQRVIAVIGSTGAGKSAVASRIASHSDINGAIISADALQVWQGLPIATNQEVQPLTEAHVGNNDSAVRCPACNGCAFADSATAFTNDATNCRPQHLVGYRNPFDGSELAEISVGVWLRDASQCISRLQPWETPVVVGGTHLYVESLLWSDMLAEREEEELIARFGVENRNAAASASGTSSADSNVARTTLPTGPPSAQEIGILSASRLVDSTTNAMDVADASTMTTPTEEAWGMIEATEDTKVTCDAENLQNELKRMLAAWSSDGTICDTATLRRKSNQMYSLLVRVNPAAAQKLHRNDFRRIRRALEVAATSEKPGKLPIASPNADTTSVLTYPSATLVIWVTSDRATLMQRLDARIDRMVELGIVAEVVSLHDTYKRARERRAANEPRKLRADLQDDAPRGVFAAIGFKEFLPYLESCGSDHHARDESRLDACFTQLRRNTKRYARQQETWIRNRIIARIRGHIAAKDDNIWLVQVDSSEPSVWEREVERVTAIAAAFVRNDKGTLKELLTDPMRQVLSSLDKTKTPWKKYRCDNCERELNGPHEWDAHLASQAHRRHLRKQRKRDAARNVRPRLENREPSAAPAKTKSLAGDSCSLAAESDQS